MSIILKGKSGGAVFRNFQLSDEERTFTANYYTQHISGGDYTTTLQDDAILDVYNNSVYSRSGFIELPLDFEIENLTPEIASVGSDGRLERLSSGLLKLSIRTPKVTIPLTIDMRDLSDEASQPKAFRSVVMGSLAHHVLRQVDERIDGSMTFENNANVFTTKDHSGKVYIRNPNLWCYGVDTTFASPWNSSGGELKAGHLITPRHVINADHFPIPAGSVIRFVGNDGSVYDRTIISAYKLPGFDIRIGVLNEDLPPDITLIKIHNNLDNYLVRSYYIGVPRVAFNKYEDAYLSGFRSILDNSPPYENRAIFEYDVYYGDSGNPTFILVDSNAVDVSVSYIAHKIGVLNQGIIDADTQAGVSTGYTVTEADFSAWPNFTTGNYLVEDSDIANGNASLWVEAGTVNGKQSYTMRESATDYWTLAWDGDSWEFTATGSPTSSFSDTSSDDVATPDLASFSTLNFSVPS